MVIIRVTVSKGVSVNVFHLELSVIVSKVLSVSDSNLELSKGVRVRKVNGVTSYTRCYQTLLR